MAEFSPNTLISIISEVSSSRVCLQGAGQRRDLWGPATVHGELLGGKDVKGKDGVCLVSLEAFRTPEDSPLVRLLQRQPLAFW